MSKLTIDQEQKKVVVHGTQYGTFHTRQFPSKWSKELLNSLWKLKKEWFLDSYNRFEDPKYVQSQIDFLTDWHNLKLEGKKILDFGCGFGASIHCLIKSGATDITGSDLEVENMDFAEAFVKEFGYEDKVKLERKNILPHIERGSFDIIFLNAVVEHLTQEEREIYLNILWKAVKPGGHLIVTETPNRWWPYEMHTSGTWWIPYLSDKNLFKKMRKMYKYCNWSDERFYRSGIVGETYNGLLECLNDRRGIQEVSLKTGYVKECYKRSANKSLKKRIAVEVLSLLESISVKVFRLPATAFMPFLNYVAFQKRCIQTMEA